MPFMIVNLCCSEIVVLVIVFDTPVAGFVLYPIHTSLPSVSILCAARGAVGSVHKSGLQIACLHHGLRVQTPCGPSSQQPNNRHPVPGLIQMGMVMVAMAVV